MLGGIAMNPETKDFAVGLDSVMCVVMLALYVLLHVWGLLRTIYPQRRREAHGYVKMDPRFKLGTAALPSIMAPVGGQALAGLGQGLLLESTGVTPRHYDDSSLREPGGGSEGVSL